MPRKPTITKPQQVEALSSPVRHQIHLALELLGPSSVLELARHMGKQPEALYYHLRKLQKVGVVEETGQQMRGGRSETIFGLRGGEVVLDRNASARAFRTSMAKGCRALLRYAERSFTRAIVSKAGRELRRRGSLRVEQSEVRLSSAELRELNRRLDEINDFVRTCSKTSRGKIHTLTFCLSSKSGD